MGERKEEGVERWKIGGRRKGKKGEKDVRGKIKERERKKE